MSNDNNPKKSPTSAFMDAARTKKIQVDRREERRNAFGVRLTESVEELNKILTPALPKGNKPFSFRKEDYGVAQRIIITLPSGGGSGPDIALSVHIDPDVTELEADGIQDVKVKLTINANQKSKPGITTSSYDDALKTMAGYVIELLPPAVVKKMDFSASDAPTSLATDSDVKVHKPKLSKDAAP